MAGSGTLLALFIGLPIALYMETYLRKSRWARYVRLALDILWGIPSIVYGAFCFILMLAIGMRASLLGGIIALTLLELPILTRAMDEVIRMLPRDLEQAALALGSTRLEVALHVVTRQMLPGIVTAILLAFGRGIGDAASVLFTAGYTDRLPTSILSPVASLPLAIYFQLSMPYPEVQKRAYAAALILTVIVLVASLGSRWIAGRLGKNVIK
jgi:phosphate transport system permease protein